MTTTDIPEGFERHFRQSPLTEPWEPLYSKRTDRAVIIGLRLARPHTNGRGLIHGGLIAALSDNAMGYSCAHVMGGVSSLVTIGLTVDFIGTAEVGQWLAVESDVIKTGSTISDGQLRWLKEDLDRTFIAGRAGDFRRQIDDIGAAAHIKIGTAAQFRLDAGGQVGRR